MRRGFFITFEGGEGCGKSTHIGMLCEYLHKRGYDVLRTREPGGPALSEKIRELLLFAKEGLQMTPRTEILLFEAARSQHVSQTIIPALESGKIVISDRYADSTAAYQGAARSIAMDEVKMLNKFATGGLEADLTILLDIPEEEGLRRAAMRDCGKTDRMGSQELNFYRDVRQAFLDMARENPERFEVVSSEGPKEQTFEKIVRAVEQRLLKNV